MPMELDAFATGVKWIPKLWRSLQPIRKNRLDELEKINNVVYGDPVEIAKYYVEPDCQDRNPADREEDDLLLARDPVMTTLNRYFKPGHGDRPGFNQMFVLSDAGMGKTALLNMLKLMHLTSFWPQSTDCVLEKLGEDTLGRIEANPNKRKTILLLDSLDEDPVALGRVRERLLEILKASKSFFRVIVTCRTQFFPETEKDPMDRLGRISIGGFNCPVKFLSFFSEEKVKAYLDKRFPKKFRLFPNEQKIREAKAIIAKMGSLRCRPMLLAYIEDLMKSPFIGEKDDEFRIYEALVQSWLEREETKGGRIRRNDLLEASVVLATHLQVMKLRKISERELDTLIEEISDVSPIKSLDLKGRSLVNRNSDGDYRFAHSSIQEFLVARLLLMENTSYTPQGRVPVTDFIFKLVTQADKALNFPHLLDCRGIRHSNGNFNGRNLRALNLSGAVLTRIDFSKCDLSGACFTGAELTECNLSGANLEGAVFNRASLKKTRISLTDTGLMDWNQDALEGIVADFGPLNAEFVFIPPGSFIMGSSKREQDRFDEEATHFVKLTRGFFIQSTPVTQIQWQSVMGDNPSHFKSCGPGCPVETVSWEDAQEFIRRMNRNVPGVGFRLPTEAEWEYACRAGSRSRYHFGDEDAGLSTYAWFRENSKSKTHPVAQKVPNAWGLYDMHGNVWEWCEDWYAPYADENEVVDPKGPAQGSDRVLRGGSWHYSAGSCRSASRGRRGPGRRALYVGFRLVFLPGQPEEQAGQVKGAEPGGG